MTTGWADCLGAATVIDSTTRGWTEEDDRIAAPRQLLTTRLPADLRGKRPTQGDLHPAGDCKRTTSAALSGRRSSDKVEPHLVGRIS